MIKVIDKVTVTLNEKRDVYEALIANLGVKGVEVSSTYVKNYESFLPAVSGAYSRFYLYEENQRGSPFQIEELKPIQMPNMDLQAFLKGGRFY